MNPADYAKAGTEHAHQVALFMWAAQNREKYPELEWMFAVPNGGERDIRVASRLKAEGMRGGVSDVCLLVARGGSHGLLIEMKKPGKGGNQSADQKRFENFQTQQGYVYQVCDNWEKARDLVIEYLES